MAILKCPSCGVANADTARACHTCTAVLPAGRAATAGGSSGNYPDDRAPGWSVAASAARRHEARAASLALQGAAWILILRGTILPHLMTMTPEPRYDADGVVVVAPRMPFGDADPDDVRLASYAAAAAFVALCVWARRSPLAAAVTGLVLYAGLCLPDLMNGDGLLEKGLIGKSITLLAIARALVAGVMHTLTPAEPSAPTGGAIQGA